MKFTNGLDKLGRFSHSLGSWFEWIAIAGFLVMMVATCIDVVGAKLFLWPLPGSIEVVFLAQVIAIAGALAITKIDGRHIRVEAFLDKLPKRWRAFLDSLTSLLGLGLFIMVGWQSYEYGQALRSAGKVTTTAQIPYYPFPLWIALCCIPICLVLLWELLNSLAELVKK